jgi:hypothetical protein
LFLVEGGAEISVSLSKVEVDESYFGAKHHHGYHGKLKRGRGTLKQPVLGVFKKDEIGY